MPLSRLLLTTCAAVCLALPSVSLADPPTGPNAPAAKDDQQPQKGAKGRRQATPPPKGAQGAPGAAQGPQAGQAVRGAKTPSRAAAPAAQGGVAGRSGQAAGKTARGTRQGQAPAAAPGTSRLRVQRAPTQAAPTVRRRTAVSPAPQAAKRQALRAPQARAPHAPPPLSGWNRSIRGPERAQLGQQWRSQHHNWDQNAPWRSNRNWWRGDSSFRLFYGPRIGFFFFPDYGYVAAPPQYRNHYWRAGDYLPDWFWRYKVRNYGRYGLPSPPDGCAWIWLSGDVALVDLSDGYILDIVYNVW